MVKHQFIIQTCLNLPFNDTTYHQQLQDTRSGIRTMEKFDTLYINNTIHNTKQTGADFTILSICILTVLEISRTSDISNQNWHMSEQF